MSYCPPQLECQLCYPFVYLSTFPQFRKQHLKSFYCGKYCPAKLWGTSLFWRFPVVAVVRCNVQMARNHITNIRNYVVGFFFAYVGPPWVSQLVNRGPKALDSVPHAETQLCFTAERIICCNWAKMSIITLGWCYFESC